MTTETLTSIPPEAHYATKADLAQAEGRLNEKIATLRADLEQSIRHMTWQLIGVVVAVAILIVTILRVWPVN